MSKRRDSNSECHEWSQERVLPAGKSGSWIFEEERIFTPELQDQYNLASESGRKGFEDREYTEQVTQKEKAEDLGLFHET